MRVQAYWTLIFLITIVAMVSWAVVATLIDPVGGGAWGSVLFFGSAAATACGIGMMLMLWVWCRAGRCAHKHHRVLRALRHGVLLGGLITAFAIMQFVGVWTWWTALMVSGFVVLIELYAILIRRSF